MRRGFRRAMIRNAQPSVPPLLRQAHELMESGRYAEAAEAFEKLARGAETRNHPKTPQLYLLAGRAHIKAGHKPAGFAFVKKGLGMLRNHPAQLFRLGNLAVTELSEIGMNEEALELTEWLKTALPAAPAGAKMGVAASVKKPVLPTRCPECGGALRADEVEWLDEVTAECAWCGSAIRAEG